MMKVSRGAHPPSGHKVTPVVHPLYCLVNAGSCWEGRGGGQKFCLDGDNHNITQINYDFLDAIASPSSYPCQSVSQ